MNRFTFTAQELFCMALLANKHKMYGIPDKFGADRRVEIQTTLDSLLQSDIATMDMDGRMMLEEVYHEIVEFVCDCHECITINNQQKDECSSSIVWKRDDRFLMAEAIGSQYMLSFADPIMVQSLFAALIAQEKIRTQFTETIVPQIVLTKAQRMCSGGKTEDAVHLLRQHGADEGVALAVADGLSQKARYVGVLHMRPTAETCKKIECSYLLSRGMCLRLGQTVRNLRSCVVFTEVEPVTLNQAVMNIAEKFLKE